MNAHNTSEFLSYILTWLDELHIRVLDISSMKMIYIIAEKKCLNFRQLRNLVHWSVLQCDYMDRRRNDHKWKKKLKTMWLTNNIIEQLDNGSFGRNKTTSYYIEESLKVYVKLIDFNGMTSWDAVMTALMTP